MHSNSSSTSSVRTREELEYKRFRDGSNFQTSTTALKYDSKTAPAIGIVVLSVTEPEAGLKLLGQRHPGLRDGREHFRRGSSAEWLERDHVVY